eukprot:scaffold26548_cov23-Prasinocladus_malaysianus.AAC.1
MAAQPRVTDTVIVRSNLADCAGIIVLHCLTDNTNHIFDRATQPVVQSKLPTEHYDAAFLSDIQPKLSKNTNKTLVENRLAVGNGGMLGIDAYAKLPWKMSMSEQCSNVIDDNNSSFQLSITVLVLVTVCPKSHITCESKATHIGLRRPPRGP